MPIENPLEALPSGIMQALQIALQVRNQNYQVQQDQLNRTRQQKLDELAMEERRQQMQQRAQDQAAQQADRHLKAVQAVAGLTDEGGKAVDSTGMVEDQTSLPSLSGAPSRYGGNPTLPLDYHRDPVAARTVDFKEFGVPTSVELASPEVRAKVAYNKAIAAAKTKKETDLITGSSIQLPKGFSDKYGIERAPAGQVDDVMRGVTAWDKTQTPQPKTLKDTKIITDDRTHKQMRAKEYSDGSVEYEDTGFTNTSPGDVARSEASAARKDKAFENGLNVTRAVATRLDKEIEAYEVAKSKTKAAIDGYKKEIAEIHRAPPKDLAAWNKLPAAERNLANATTYLGLIADHQKAKIKAKDAKNDEVIARQQEYYGDGAGEKPASKTAAPKTEETNNPSTDQPVDTSASGYADLFPTDEEVANDTVNWQKMMGGGAPAGAPYAPQIPYLNAPAPAPIPYAPGQAPVATPRSAAPAATAPVAAAWGPNPFRKKVAKGK